MTILDDTSLEGQKVWTEVFRAMPVQHKWRLLKDAFASARILHAAGVRSRDPRITPEKVQAAWTKAHYGKDFLGKDVMASARGNLNVLTEVVKVFARLDIPYALGGSMASSIHGIARFTLDADITVEPFPGKEEALASSFGKDYYLSLPAIQDAVRGRSSFNIIHMGEGFKVDVFVRKDDPFEESALTRRVQIPLDDAGTEPIAVLSAEDVVLFKLQWYRLGQETSRRQLDDILGIVRTRPLDEEYIATWVKHLGVEGIWRQVQAERGQK